jgi:hypothetical protein
MISELFEEKSLMRRKVASHRNFQIRCNVDARPYFSASPAWRWRLKDLTQLKDQALDMSNLCLPYPVR